MRSVCILPVGPVVPFPDPLRCGSDLVAIGGVFKVERLLLAYRSGIFPWSVNPVTWWSPDPRAVIDLDARHIPRSLRRSLRRFPFRFTLDTAFDAVIHACAKTPRRQESTWISPEFIRAYGRLHDLGHAHSIECWLEDQLVGGLYGVQAGSLFAGESMFHRVTDASKASLCVLLHHLHVQGFTLFDTQMITPTTRLLGAHPIPREEYLRRLQHAVRQEARFRVSPDDPRPHPLP